VHFLSKVKNIFSITIKTNNLSKTVMALRVNTAAQQQHCNNNTNNNNNNNTVILIFLPLSPEEVMPNPGIPTSPPPLMVYK